MNRSEIFFKRAQDILVGGVNSPVRAFKAVGGTPLFIAKAQGAYLEDVDHQRYIDFVGSWGPAILGHAYPEVVRAVVKVARAGLSFGAPSPLETELAEEIMRAIPSVEKVRLVSSGTEATMTAIRLARGATGRNKIVKFAGCYHGHSDALLVAAGSGAATFGVPNSLGVPKELAAQTMVLPYNNLRAAKRALEKWGKQIAGVIVEPVAGNMGVVEPTEKFLPALREWTTAAGSLLIFDEVMTGFRLALGGAETLYGVRPDLTCCGKIVGGGMPLAVVGGAKKWMQHLSPQGAVYQAGTLSGNPLAVTAGLVTLKTLRRLKPYALLESAGRFLESELKTIFEEVKIPIQVNRVGSMLTVFFTEEKVDDFATAARSDRSLFASWHRALLSEGIYWPPSPLEAAFFSVAHTPKVLRDAVVRFRRAARKIK